MTRLIVTGVSGLLGSNLAMCAWKEQDLIGIYYRHPIEIEGVRMIAADLSQSGTALQIISQHRPDWVVHCAAATDVDRCEREPEWARVLNVEMAEDVARACYETGTQLAHISTDAVFDGRSGGYREDDPAMPINVYGETKLAGERGVLEANPQALILRTNLYGWSPDGRRGLAQWFVNRLSAGQVCAGFTNVCFSPLYTQHLGHAILDLLERQASGLFHLAGRTCLSKYEFGVSLARRMGLDPNLIEPVTIDQMELEAERPKQLCMYSGKAEAILGRRLPGVEQGLRELAETRKIWRSQPRMQPTTVEFTSD